MTRRTATVTTASVLLVALVCVAFLLPVPYVTVRPGPTRDVLAMSRGVVDGGESAPVVSIEGRRTYPTEGSLRLTTVSVTSPDDSVGIGEAFQAWLSPDDAVLPREAVYPEDQTPDEAEELSATQMADSQELAAAAALRLLGADVPEQATVATVEPGAPADGVLRAGDVILSVDGERAASAEDTLAAIRDREIGDDVRLTVGRGDSEEQVSVTTAESPSPDPETGETYPVVGITAGVTYDLPVDVQINLSNAIGGPSAGSVFALAIYDELTPGSLIDGLAVAGTGEISADGVVGRIGGIQQKVVGAVDAGAEIFLVPAGNCAEAVGVGIDPDAIRLVEVADLESAVDSLRMLSEDPDADVPSCG